MCETSFILRAKLPWQWWREQNRMSKSNPRLSTIYIVLEYLLKISACIAKWIDQLYLIRFGGIGNRNKLSWIERSVELEGCPSEVWNCRNDIYWTIFLISYTLLLQILCYYYFAYQWKHCASLYTQDKFPKSYYNSKSVLFLWKYACSRYFGTII